MLNAHHYDRAKNAARHAAQNRGHVLESFGPIIHGGMTAACKHCGRQVTVAVSELTGALRYGSALALDCSRTAVAAQPAATTTETMLTDLAAVAAALLDKIDTITTEEFRSGDERVEREALRAMLLAVKQR